jgi:hypothetical protein
MSLGNSVLDDGDLGHLSKKKDCKSGCSAATAMAHLYRRFSFSFTKFWHSEKVTKDDLGAVSVSSIEKKPRTKSARFAKFRNTDGGQFKPFLCLVN